MTEPDLGHIYIRELEISITSRCNLACAQCGFLVPDQPEPTLDEPVAEISGVLDILFHIGVRVRSLAILGGEPTIDGRLLERVLSRLAAIGIAERLEVVTNGLTPRGLTETSLRHLGRLSISVYGLSEALRERYRTWLEIVAPRVDVVFRMNENGWDPWTGRHQVSPARAQEMFDSCWYRRHCVTLERRRLFVCSRIPKLNKDDEGLIISPTTTLDEISRYLNQTRAMPSCATCTPMMGLPSVSAGVQADDRLPRLERRAVAWLDTAILNASARSL